MSFKCYEDNCSVCLEKVNIEADAILICGHQHHITCVQGLTACPVCLVPMVLLYPLFSKYKDEIVDLKSANSELSKENTRLCGVIMARNTRINALRNIEDQLWVTKRMLNKLRK